jgi:hypothetical protein
MRVCCNCLEFNKPNLEHQYYTYPFLIKYGPSSEFLPRFIDHFRQQINDLNAENEPVAIFFDDCRVSLCGAFSKEVRAYTGYTSKITTSNNDNELANNATLITVQSLTKNWVKPFSLYYSMNKINTATFYHIIRKNIHKVLQLILNLTVLISDRAGNFISTKSLIDAEISALNIIYIHDILHLHENMCTNLNKIIPGGRNLLQVAVRLNNAARIPIFIFDRNTRFESPTRYGLALFSSQMLTVLMIYKRQLIMQFSKRFFAITFNLVIHMKKVQEICSKLTSVDETDVDQLEEFVSFMDEHINLKITAALQLRNSINKILSLIDVFPNLIVSQLTSHHGENLLKNDSITLTAIEREQLIRSIRDPSVNILDCNTYDKLSIPKFAVDMAKEFKSRETEIFSIYTINYNLNKILKATPCCHCEIMFRGENNGPNATFRRLYAVINTQFGLFYDNLKHVAGFDILLKHNVQQIVSNLNYECESDHNMLDLILSNILQSPIRYSNLNCL